MHPPLLLPNAVYSGCGSYNPATFKGTIASGCGGEVTIAPGGTLQYGIGGSGVAVAPNGLVLAVVPSTRELIYQQLGRQGVKHDERHSFANQAAFCLLLAPLLQFDGAPLVPAEPSEPTRRRLARSQPGWRLAPMVQSGCWSQIPLFTPAT